MTKYFNRISIYIRFQFYTMQIKQRHKSMMRFIFNLNISLWSLKIHFADGGDNIEKTFASFANNLRRKSLFCFITRFPSLVSSKDAAKIPALPVLFKIFDVLKFLGINSSIFFHFTSLPKKFLILLPIFLKKVRLGM